MPPHSNRSERGWDAMSFFVNFCAGPAARAHDRAQWQITKRGALRRSI
ncbi:MAG: hypothetical protein ACLGQX_01645 [Acidobacteriota bacterium]